ncbi:MAG: 3-oxoacyl-[acyl-carrier-protein] reductase [Dehalococcoidia bacterium]|nr:3-oxoacyl-[acyl-carrier-protein] reductase [Dehalococcoidia bacterium]
MGELSLKDRVALVTGASRGIGRAIALKLAGCGARVVVNYKSNDERAAETVDLIVKAGGEAVSVKADVSNSEAVSNMYKDIIARWQKIDILVNNAGITADGLILRLSDKAWDDVIATNLRGAFLCSRLALRTMLRQQWGRIVNITSVAGLIGNVGQTNYSASKAGLIGFTRALAKEVAPQQVTVNAVAPGFIVTEMTERLSAEQKEMALSRIPLRRLGVCDDVAGLVAFLCSDAAGYITGQVIAVDGGVGI